MWKIETFIEEYTLYVGQWHLSPLQSRHPGTPHSSPDLHQLPCHIFLNLTRKIWSEISFLPKVILVLVKARSRRAPSLGCRGAESPGWFDVSLKNSSQDMMHEQVHCCDEAANYQLPIAVAFWIIWIVSAEECWSLTQNLMQIHCSAHLVILNMKATQYTCSLNGVYHPPD